MNPRERFKNACLRLPVDRPPVWLMRQAGRYLTPYRELRAQHSTLKMMQTPALAAEITLQPVRLIGTDAAILYSDILMVPDAMGLGLKFVEGEGPKFTRPVRSRPDVHALQAAGVVDRLNFVFETIRLVRQELKNKPTEEGILPLLGFAGAPFTVATYMVEGGSSNDFAEVRKLIQQDGALFHALLEKVTEATIDYLKAQVKAGVDAVQLFDTWGGILSAAEYATWSLPYTQKVLAALGGSPLSKFPTILFVKGGAPLLEQMVTAGPKVIGVDAKTSLTEARRRTQNKVALQGNLDPDLLLRPIPEIEKGVQAMVADWGGSPGYIMNLGHGVLPETPVAHVRVFVKACKKYGPKIS